MQEATDFLSTRLIEIGGTSLSARTLLSALLVLVATFVATWVVRIIVSRLQKRLSAARIPTIYVGGQIVRYAIVFVGLAATISTLGIDLSALSLFAGALGVGIGFGLQDVVKNFVCGIILLFDNSIEVGDYVELEDGTSGAVASIGPRATVLVTPDNVDVLVPNSSLLNGKLTNWTRNHVTRRIHVPFNVAYGSNKELVKIAALEAARSVSFTSADDGNRRTQVWLVGFGDSAMHFELVVWPSLEAVKRPGSMMAAYFWAIDDALRRHEIEIPFPQRDIRLRDFFGHEGQMGLDAFHAKLRPARAYDADAPKQAISVNDAAEDIDVTNDISVKPHKG